LTIAVGLLAFGDVDTSVRPVLTLGFLAVCPGLAFVRLLRIKERWMEWTLAVALSVALETLVATASLYGGFWSPNGVLAIVLCLTMVGLLLEFAASFRIVPRRATAPGQ
jgi:hypothetical protein